MTREFLRNQGTLIVPAKGRAYYLRAFEVERRLVDAEISISERELTNQKSILAFSDDELVRQLEALGVTTESLELPYKSDYPI